MAELVHMAELVNDCACVPFQPEKLCMLPEGGRVYCVSHGTRQTQGIGLIKSGQAIELSRFFVYEEGADESSSPVELGLDEGKHLDNQWINFEKTNGTTFIVI